MKYFVIEIEKPYKESVQEYQQALKSKINNSQFEVVKVCSSYDEAEGVLALLTIKNVRAQSGLHYEIIAGDGVKGLKGLQKEIEDFYKKVS